MNLPPFESPAGHRTRRRLLLDAAALLAVPMSARAASPLPIGRGPQVFADDYLVDNRWGFDELGATITRVFHRPVKHAANPLIPNSGGYISIARDERAGIYRLWYQKFWQQSIKPNRYTYGTAYAESVDGVRWKEPRIGKHLFMGTRDNNIVLLGPAGGRAECQFLLDLPEEHRRGYRYVMLYVTDDPGQRGMHIIGSQDGIDWDPSSDVRIVPDFTPDTQNSIVWDPRSRKFVCFTRAVNLYRDGESGPRRRVARFEHDRLWEPWPLDPENILVPDATDAASGHNYFYGMPVRYYAGLYWGFLWPYNMASGAIDTELALSRDGREFARQADHRRLIELGGAGAWDRGMTFGSTWIEMGDEWWIYYSGANGSHNERDPVTGIGAARIRKEGFFSLRTPAGGGVVVTRLLAWPGGGLQVNAEAARGEVRVRVTDYRRRPLTGFAEPSRPLTGDGVRQAVKWDGADLNALAGQSVRLEFHMKGAVDLYGFHAG